jgi:ribonucleotide monophosphatase NagD (HAD superfamily)
MHIFHEVYMPNKVADNNLNSLIFRLRESGLKVKFVTNTTKESSRALHRRLTSLGFDVTRDEIFSSLAAARLLVKERGVRPMLLVDKAAEEEFEGLPHSDGPKNAVLVGLAPKLMEYSVLNEAFRYVTKIIIYCHFT